ncbi:MAG: metal ABC transporter permease [Geminicoccaceae bacterium]
MAHAILGAAFGFLLAALSLFWMTLGGLIAGLTVALLAGLVSRHTSLAGFYLCSLALWVLIVSLRGSNVDLIHVLFGAVLALDDHALFLLTVTAILSFFTLASIYRALVIECFDPTFLRPATHLGSIIHLLFLGLVLLNLVDGFRALGTLMAVGLLLPAATARFWTLRLEPMLAIALLIAFHGEHRRPAALLSPGPAQRPRDHPL